MRYILTILISLFSLISIAQPPQESVCMPVEVAKQVAQDLVTGDSAKAILNSTLEELDLTKEKLSYKDSLILNAKIKELNLNDQLRVEKEKSASYNGLYEDAKKQFADLSKKYKRLKAKKTFIEILGTAIIGGLTYLYITK